jgi:hypothetical protein
MNEKEIYCNKYTLYATTNEISKKRDVENL